MKRVNSRGDALNSKERDQFIGKRKVVEIESEKANYEIEADADGTVVEVLVSEGEEAKVGDVVVRIEP